VTDSNNISANKPNIHDVLSAEMSQGYLSFERFMQLCLYHPTLGYYTKPRKRIGLNHEADFYTASNSNPVFGELIIAACNDLLKDKPIKDYTFVELGAERSIDKTTKTNGIISSLSHPFKEVISVGNNDPISLKGPCVIFSNELFDAQPFKRFKFSNNQWRELGVSLRDGVLCEVELPTPVDTHYLPKNAPEGYHIDSPELSIALLKKITSQPWTGLFIACDYGKSWNSLANETPQGTARAYYHHTQSNDLLANPGDQDLTCHVCWDWIMSALKEANFESLNLQSQEAFFVNHSGSWISSEIAKEAGQFSHKKRSLIQLIHPSHLGAKFQIINASRS
jgi:SAM-dependent MidA family methyltransferase